MDFKTFLIYIVAMAGVTYLIRMLPFVLVKKKITNKFVLSFLYYMPYAVLSVMTVPAIFFATPTVASAVVGFAVAILLAMKNRSLTTVAASSCVAVLITEVILTYVF